MESQEKNQKLYVQCDACELPSRLDMCEKCGGVGFSETAVDTETVQRARGLVNQARHVARFIESKFKRGPLQVWPTGRNFGVYVKDEEGGGFTPYGYTEGNIAALYATLAGFNLMKEALTCTPHLRAEVEEWLELNPYPNSERGAQFLEDL